MSKQFTLSLKGRILKYLLTKKKKNIGRELGRCRGTWASEKTDLGDTPPVSPRISSLTSMSHFLTCTMGIIVKARVVVKGNEKVCVYSTYHSDSTVNSRHYSRQSRSRAQGAFLKLASLGEDWP